MFGLSNYNLIISIFILLVGIQRFTIQELLVRAIVIFPALIAHEFAHGYASYKLGDSTAKSMGRLSLNPFKHLDPVGAALILSFGFGWAKPVMFNPYYFKNPKRDIAITSAAGPLANFILAFLGIAIWKLLVVFQIPVNAVTGVVITFLSSFISINVSLGIFNLLPIPPLDGSKIFLPLLPNRLYMDILRYERFGFLILIAALALGILSPIINTFSNGIIRLFLFLVGGL